MKFAAVLRSWVTGKEASNAPLEALGSWVRLQSYCASDGQESATIKGAKDWTGRNWISRVNLTRVEVELAVSSGLARWIYSDLFVEGFDESGPRKAKILRDNGKFGALGGRKGNPVGNPGGTLEGTPSPLPLPLLSKEPEKRIASRPEDGATKPMALQLVPSEPAGVPNLPDPEPSPPPLVTFPVVGGKAKVWNLTKAHVETWKADFPGFDVLAECRKARAWCEANQAKRKTPGGMPKFLVGWLTRQQNEGKSRFQSEPAAASGAPAMTPEEETRIVAERRKDNGVSAAELAEAFPWMAKS